MDREIDYVEQPDGEWAKHVYTPDIGKHDFYEHGADGLPDGDGHDHLAWYDAAVDGEAAVADYVRVDDEVIYDTGFYSPSEQREDFFSDWQ